MSSLTQNVMLAEWKTLTRISSWDCEPPPVPMVTRHDAPRGLGIRIIRGLGLGPLERCDSWLVRRCCMSDLVLLSRAQMRRIRLVFPTCSHPRRGSSTTGSLGGRRTTPSYWVWPRTGSQSEKSCAAPDIVGASSGRFCAASDPTSSDHVKARWNSTCLGAMRVGLRATAMELRSGGSSGCKGSVAAFAL